jgi:ABC-type multidrug transport system fused ATPase/permease subunit
MSHEDHGERDAGRTRQSRTYLDWGPALLIVGLFVLAIVWTVTILEPIPEAAASISRTAALTLVLVGAFLTIVHRAEMRAAAGFRAMTAPIATLAAQVQLNTSAIGQLTAARTVDMHNLHAAEERMEGLARSLAVDAIEDLRKEIRAHGEAMDERARNWERQYAETRATLAGIRRTSAIAAAKGESVDAKAEAILETVAQINGVRLKLDELWERFKDLEADLAGFRLAQAELPAKANGHGTVSILRALPTQPD